MRDINYYRVQHLPVIIFFTIVGFWMKNSEVDISKDKVVEIKGAIASSIKEGDLDGANHFMEFKIESYENWFRLSNNAREAVIRTYGVKKLKSLLSSRYGVIVAMGVDKEDFDNDKKVISIRYISVDGKVITTFDDYARLVGEDIKLAHDYYWCGFLLSFLFLLKAFLGINIHFNRDRLIKPSELIDYEKAFDNRNEFNGFLVKQSNEKIEIFKKNKLLIRFDLEKNLVYYRKYWFFVFSKFEDIEDYGVRYDNRDVDFMLRLKKGLDFQIVNTKFGEETFVDFENKDKYMIEMILYVLLHKITHPNNKYT